MDLTSMDLNPELLTKAKACSTPEELVALVQDEGLELSDEVLEGVAGGDWDNCSILYERLGDMRDDIDESDVPTAFMTGELRGDGLD